MQNTGGGTHRDVFSVILLASDAAILEVSLPTKGSVKITGRAHSAVIDVFFPVTLLLGSDVAISDLIFPRKVRVPSLVQNTVGPESVTVPSSDTHWK